MAEVSTRVSYDSHIYIADTSCGYYACTVPSYCHMLIHIPEVWLIYLYLDVPLPYAYRHIPIPCLYRHTYGHIKLAHTNAHLVALGPIEEDVTEDLLHLHIICVLIAFCRRTIGSVTPKYSVCGCCRAPPSSGRTPKHSCCTPSILFSVLQGTAILGPYP